MNIAILGVGTIGGALARRLSIGENTLTLYDRHPEKLAPLAEEVGATVSPSASDAISSADLVIVSIKPQGMAAAAEEWSGLFNSSQQVISVLAGTTIATLEQMLGTPHIVRMMPNLGMCWGKGVIGLAENQGLTQDAKQQLESLFYCLGVVEWFGEDKLDALTALTGSGPAFHLVSIGAAIDAAIAMGFSPEQARRLVLATLASTVAMLEGTGQSPEVLCAQVASPGGTTEAGLDQLEKRAVHGGIVKAYLAACRRAEELAN